jgi:tRNA G18 (ribose-2'-O)-methylase SpoU
VVTHVASLSDPRLDDYRNVPDPELLRRRGLFIAEGRQVVRRLLTESRFTARSLLLTPAARAGLADLLARPGLPPVYVLAQQDMNAVTGFNLHRGCLAAGERGRPLSWRPIAGEARHLVVLEHVANADNVGAIFRCAAAFGADAVLLGPSCADPLYRKSIRTSMGAALRLPFATLDDWPADLSRLKARGFIVLALTPSEEAVPLDEAAQRCLAEPSPIALALGHEGHGLSAAALQAADLRVRIPMGAGADSLNVAAAAAIALYALRPR